MKKALALVLALLMVMALFAGCTKGGGTETTNTPAASSGTANSGSSSGGNSASYTEADERPEDAAKAVIEGGEFKLPITDETKSFTVWIAFDPGGSNMTSLNDSLAYQKAEELTNVHIDWYHISSANAAESFSIAMAGNDYDDMYVNVGSYLVNGADWYIDNDIFYDLEQYIAQCCPNYDYVRRLDQRTYLSTITDTHRAVGMTQLVQTMQWAWLGAMGRTDWARGAGIAEPRTYDEYYTVLKGMRDIYGCPGALCLPTNGCFDFFMVGMDMCYVPNNNGYSFQNHNGTAVFGPTEPGFKEYIQLMAQWYSEGLIDHDFYARTTSAGFDTSAILNGEFGICQSLYTFPTTVEGLAAGAGDTTLEFRGFRPAARNVGDPRRIPIGYESTSLNKNCVSCFATSNEDIEVLLRWNDYFYTEEGAMLGNYGIEGTSYTMVDGKPQITDLILRNPDGLAMNAAFPKYSFWQIVPYWYDWEREISPESPDAVWDTERLFTDTFNNEWTMPDVTFTQAESAEFNAIMNDVHTYMSENIVALITGQKKIDQLDSIIDQLSTMNIDRATAIYQAALDRYLAR